MKFRLNAEARKKAKLKKYRNWNKWFAWFPVRLASDPAEVRWLEFVYRKGKCLYYEDGAPSWIWKYEDSVFGILKE